MTTAIAVPPSTVGDGRRSTAPGSALRHPWREGATFLLIVYVLEKDVFRYPRYHFLYSSAVLVLLASGLTAAVGTTSHRPWARRLTIGGLLAAGLAGTGINAYGYGLQDSYYARRLAREIIADDAPALIVMGGDSFLTTAMSLGIAREISIGAAGSSPEAHWFGYVPWASKVDHRWPGALTIAGPVPRQAWLIHRPADTRFPVALEVRSSADGHTLVCTPGPEGLRRWALEYLRYECPGSGAR